MAGEKLVFRDSKTKYYSSILKIKSFIIHLHNSLIQWDKMRTVSQSQQLIHQDPPGSSIKYPQNILYILCFEYHICFSQFWYIFGTLKISLRVSVVF